MPYVNPSTQWFKVTYKHQDHYIVEWSDEVDLEHGVLVVLQPTLSLIKHFVSIEYTNLTQKHLADYLERVDLANNKTK
jgi:hypothetical protein